VKPCAASRERSSPPDGEIPADRIRDLARLSKSHHKSFCPAITDPRSPRFVPTKRNDYPFFIREIDTMRTMFRTLLGLGLVALLASPAAAQGRGRGFGNVGILLGNASVQKELKLDDQQVEKAKELAEKTGEKMQELRESLQGLEGEERMTKMQQLNRELNESTLKSAAAFLKPEQIARLKQISYQQRGAQAFSDPEVSKKLNLTDTQKSDIQTIVQDSFQEMRTIFQENQDDPEARMKKMTELQKQTRAKAEAKLNDEQSKSWKELLGAAFEVKYEQN
jgi:hypothetical protein